MHKILSFHLAVYGLSNSDALLYGYLNGFAKALGKDLDERIVWESIRSMASKLNMSPTAVSECIKHLESAGLLKVQRAKGKPTVICVLHDLKDNEDRFGLEDEEDEEFDDSELEWLPDYAKDAIRAWREEDTEDEDSEQREWVDDVEDGKINWLFIEQKPRFSGVSNEINSSA